MMKERAWCPNCNTELIEGNDPDKLYCTRCEYEWVDDR